MGGGALRKAIIGVVLTVLFLSMLTFRLSIRRTEATTISVPRDYKTIQQAVDAAVNGDTILVAAGAYNEPVVIDGKSISLIGENASNTIIYYYDG
jgi:serine protease